MGAKCKQYKPPGDMGWGGLRQLKAIEDAARKLEPIKDNFRQLAKNEGS